MKFAVGLLFFLYLSALTLSAQKTGARAGATDPAGNPQNLTLFRDQQVFVMSPGTKATPWQTNVVGFDGKLNPTGTVSQLPWSGNIPFTQQAIQAVAGRFLTPAKDDIALVQRSESNPTDLVVRFQDGSLPTTLTSNFTPRQPSWSDLFATSAGDLDRLYDAKGNYHDEVAAAWIEMEPVTNEVSFAVPHVAVVNYNDPTHPAVLSQRLNRDDNGYAFYSWLTEYDAEINDPDYPGVLPYVLQSNDNLVATAIGDFDGDGFNELAVAYMRGQQGIVISIVIYRYQNDGRQASLTPLSTFEIYNPKVSMVGTLSLAAGDFDGSGFDQLMVGSAYYSGTLNNGGHYQKGTLTTQPVVFLVKGGQASGTVSSAVSAGAGATATTNVTVSLGQGAYVPQTVTIAGAIGSWAAINGTWQVVPTATGFSLPVDSSQFGPFSGQNVQVSVAAPLAQADKMSLDAFPSLPGYSPGPIPIDDADRDGRIRVQMVPGLFRYDPANGFSIRRRQVAMAWNARPAPSKNGLAAKDGDPHLALLQVTNDDKIVQAYVGNGLLEYFQTFQTLSLAAGAFRGDNDTNDPTWSIFLSGVGQAYPQTNPLAEGVVSTVLSVSPDSKDTTKLTVSPVCYGKASGDPYPPPYYGFNTDNPPICQLWGDNARMESPTGPYPFPANNYMRLPAIAADLNGNSLKLGAPVHYEITKPVKAHYILEQPPQHAAYLDYGDGNGPQVQTISRYPAFNTSMVDSTNRVQSTTEKNHTDWTVGASAQVSASSQDSVGLSADDTGVGTKVKVAITAKASYDYDHVHDDYTNTASSQTVQVTHGTGTDDLLSYNAEILDVWRYRIFGSGTDTGDPQKPYAYYDIVLPGGATSIVSYPGGRDVDWYQPIHETGNILSYPSRSDVCNPSDIGAITVGDKVNQVIPLITCTQQYYNGTSSNISLNFNNTSGAGGSTDYTHKVHADVDVSVSYTVGSYVLGTGGLESYSGDLDVHGGVDWGHLSTSDDTTSISSGITVNSPQGDSEHAYPYYPIFYDTDAGALKVAFAVGDLKASGGGGFWTDYYGQQPDPALNLPARFNATYSDNAVFNGWEADQSINRKKMRGFVVRSSQADSTGYYPLLGHNPRDGDVVMFETRVYNYSISSTPTSPITVQLSVIPMDDRNNEICRSAGGQQPNYKIGGHVCPVSDRTVIGIASSAPVNGNQAITLNARENQLTYLMWNTKGFGPKAGTTLYRVYVDLISDPNNEIYPPEKPCTALPCEDAQSIENIVDPGQNNEGWSLISVEAPAQGFEAGAPGSPAPDAAQLTLGSDTPLLGGPQGNFLTATLGRPLPLRLSAFSTTPTPLHSYASIYDGKPGETANQMVAAKTVQGLRPEGSTVWHNWTPLALVPHHLYAAAQNSNGAQPLGDLLVDVQRSIGDLNGDGRVDSHDLNILARDLGKSVAESACGAACDIDGDGQITQTDSLLMSNLCDSQSCAFATSEYVGGGNSPLEPDMQAQRAADQAARIAWLAAHPEAQGILGSTPPVSYGLVAYRDELERKVGLHSVLHYYKGKLVTTGPLAAWPPTSPAQIALYAKPVTREGTEVEVPLVLVSNGTGPISALDLTKLGVQTLAGTGQATILSSNFSLPSGGLLPGASITVSVRLQVPPTVRKLKLMEEGSVQSGSSGPYQFSSGQIVFP